MKIILFFVGFMLTVSYCINKSNKKFADEEIKSDVDSGRNTWMFKTPFGDTVYSTQFKRKGTPQLGPVFNNTGRSLYPVQWYYGDSQPWKWITVKDDKFHISVNPNCQLIGLKK